MDTRDLKVLIQNVLKYEDKKNPGVYKTRLGYFVPDSESLQSTDKFKGFAELSYFSNDTKLFESLETKHMGQSAVLKFKEVSNPSNPLKSSLKLTTIEFKNETISLL